ncbi:MAG: hypothetical protein J6M18_05980, partial [Actinomycetaceae bacterium]|nr:hypothetical protein [Actinomycetaceae bacterium]
VDESLVVEGRVNAKEERSLFFFSLGFIPRMLVGHLDDVTAVAVQSEENMYALKNDHYLYKMSETTWGREGDKKYETIAVAR